MRVLLPYIIAGAVLVSVVLFITRKEHTYDPAAKVHISKTGDRYQLIKNGKAYTIKGASGSAAYLKDLRAAGGNTIRYYDTLNFKSKLDSAHKYGISVIADIPIPAYRKDHNPYETAFKRTLYKKEVTSFVSRYKDHPALLMWVLGNEINYPITNSGQGFTSYYNELVAAVKNIDPDHPVTTAIRQSGRHLIVKLWYTTDLDLIAINTFGGVKELEKDFKRIRFLWNGPYMISEWNDEGPWTEISTKWGAPIEPTSSKKAERLTQVHREYIAPLHDRCLGSLIFYWGFKHEQTHTWFSLFDEEGEKTPSVYAMENIFKDKKELVTQGPELEFMMLNRYGPQESLILTQGQINTADVFFKAPDCDHIRIDWEILPEVWNRSNNANNKELKPSPLNHIILEKKDNLIRFLTPEQEGPYRIFCYIKDQKGNTATANFPFYVINQAHAQN